MASNTRREFLDVQPLPVRLIWVRFADLCRTGTKGFTRLQKSSFTSHDFGLLMITPDLTFRQNPD